VGVGGGSPADRTGHAKGRFRATRRSLRREPAAERGVRREEGFEVRRALITTVVVLVAVGAAGWYGLHWIPFDSGYGLEAEFVAVPPDDEALAAWVRAQPRVYVAYVNRKRVGDRWRVEVLFGITRNGWGQPPLPALDAAAADFGYRGPAGPFRDSPR
jgi:hypothetical protein